MFKIIRRTRILLKSEKHVVRRKWPRGNWELAGSWLFLFPFFSLSLLPPVCVYLEPSPFFPFSLILSFLLLLLSFLRFIQTRREERESSRQSAWFQLLLPLLRKHLLTSSFDFNAQVNLFRVHLLFGLSSCRFDWPTGTERQFLFFHIYVKRRKETTANQGWSTPGRSHLLVVPIELLTQSSGTRLGLENCLEKEIVILLYLV